MSSIVTIDNLRINVLTDAQYDAAVANDEIGDTDWSLIIDSPTTGSLSTTITLHSTDWINNAQQVQVTGVTTTNNVFVSPATNTLTIFDQAGVLCTGQGMGTLTFTCVNVPFDDIDVNVMVLQ